MHDNLPKVFKNTITKDSDNNQKIYYSFIDKEKKSKKTKMSMEDFQNLDTDAKIKYIMRTPKYIFNINLEIITKYETLQTQIIGRKDNYIVTKDNRLLPINDIEDIKVL